MSFELASEQSRSRATCHGDLVQWMTAAVHVLLRLADSPGASADGADGGYGRFSCARSDA